MKLNLSKGHTRNPNRKPKGSQRAHPKAWEKAREVRNQMPRYARQADVAKELDITRARLEQVELEVLSKIIVATAKKDSPDDTDIAGLRTRIAKAVPGSKCYLDKMSGASLLLVEEVISELTRDPGSVFPEF